MLAKKTLSDLGELGLQGKRVLLRSDLNVPLSNGQVMDDTRIKAALPTIEYLSKRGAKVLLLSHLDRPGGKVVESLRMTPVQECLSQLLGKEVLKTDVCVGPPVKEQVRLMANGDVLLFENIRFYDEETKNDRSFSKALADLADVFVLDAFGTAHRAHASTCGVGEFLPGFAGLLLERELEVLQTLVSAPKRPFVAIVGGAKVSSKIGVLENLLSIVDVLIIGGAMVFTFLKAEGVGVGKSLVEDDKLDVAKRFLALAAKSTAKVLFPLDQVVVPGLSSENLSTVDIDRIPDDQMGLDVGPKTVQQIQEEVETAGTVLWNGPLGVFEDPRFANGTYSVARMLAESQALTIVGGGDSVSALNQAGVADQITHVSTGGGASLAFLEGKPLPGVSILSDRKKP